jgi:hypothetical protein
MISNNLFDEILLEPARKGYDRLVIVSGYATAAMAFRHLRELKEINPNVRVDLIVGMCAQDGLSKSNHRGFQKLMDEDFNETFTCSYIPNCPPVHSKTYVWLKDDKPMEAYVGSANYTQTAFSSQRELMAKTPPTDAYAYVESFDDETIYANHQDAESLVTIYKDQYFSHMQRQKKLFGR